MAKFESKHEESAAFDSHKAAWTKHFDALEKEADKGIFISGEKMLEWINSCDTENEQPEPEPDIFPKNKNVKFAAE
jgi:predicted transcriptional regulator